MLGQIVFIGLPTGFGKIYAMLFYLWPWINFLQHEMGIGYVGILVAFTQLFWLVAASSYNSIVISYHTSTSEATKHGGPSPSEAANAEAHHQPLSMEAHHHLRPLSVEAHHRLGSLSVEAHHRLRLLSVEAHHCLRLLSVEALRPLNLETDHCLRPLSVEAHHHLKPLMRRPITVGGC